MNRKKIASLAFRTLMRASLVYFSYKETGFMTAFVLAYLLIMDELSWVTHLMHERYFNAKVKLIIYKELRKILTKSQKKEK